MGYFLTGLICLVIGFIGGVVVMKVYGQKAQAELAALKAKLP